MHQDEPAIPPPSNVKKYAPTVVFGVLGSILIILGFLSLTKYPLEGGIPEVFFILGGLVLVFAIAFAVKGRNPDEEKYWSTEQRVKRRKKYRENITDPEKKPPLGEEFKEENTGVYKKKIRCPKCKGIITIKTPKRPLKFQCNGCGKQGMLKK